MNQESPAFRHGELSTLRKLFRPLGMFFEKVLPHSRICSKLMACSLSAGGTQRHSRPWSSGAVGLRPDSSWMLRTLGSTSSTVPCRMSMDTTGLVSSSHHSPSIRVTRTQLPLEHAGDVGSSVRALCHAALGAALDIAVGNHVGVFLPNSG